MKNVLFSLFLSALLFGCDILPKGVSLYVISSYGGVALEDVLIKVNNSLLEMKTDKSGFILLDLEEGIYTITLEKEGYAQSTLQQYNFVQKSEIIEMILPPLKGATNIVKSPFFEKLQISDASNTKLDLIDNMTIKESFFMIATLSASNPIIDTPDGATTVSFLIDKTPSGFGYYPPTSYTKESEKEGENYITEAVFTFENRLKQSGAHFISLVSYDIANNRAEMRIPINVQEIEDSQLSIKSSTPEILEYEMKTFAVDRQILSTDSRQQRTGTGYMVITVKGIDSNNSYLEYDGIEIYRKESGVLPYRLVSTEHFSQHLISYEVLDSSTALQPTKKYDYKIRAFNNGGFSRECYIRSVEMLSEHTLEMIQTKNIINPTSDTIAFKIVDKGTLLESNPSYYDFSLNIKSSDGKQVFTTGTNKYVPTYRYLFDSETVYTPIDPEGVKAVSYINYANGTFTINLAQLGSTESFTFFEGVSYEWYIDYSTHGPTCGKQYFNIKKEFLGQSISIASSIEYNGIGGAGSSTFSINWEL